MQLTAAAVTPPAEHAARRPAGAAGAVAADASVKCSWVEAIRFELGGKPKAGTAILSRKEIQMRRAILVLVLLSSLFLLVIDKGITQLENLVYLAIGIVSILAGFGIRIGVSKGFRLEKAGNPAGISAAIIAFIFFWWLWSQKLNQYEALINNIIYYVPWGTIVLGSIILYWGGSKGSARP